MTTPSKPEASLRELRNEIDSIRDRLMVYGISGERLYGIDEWSEPAVRLAKVIERLDALSARDEAGATQEWRWVDERGRAMTNWKQGEPPMVGEVSDSKGTMRVEVRAIATPPASGEAEAGAVGEDAKWKRLDFERYGGMADFDVGGVTLRLTYEEACVVDGILSRVIADFTALIRRLAAAAPPTASGVSAVVADMNDALAHLANGSAITESDVREWVRRLAAVAPAGMVLVPREPTDPMIEAATETAFTLDPDESTHGWATAIYAAMLAAAPTPPATAGEE